MIHGNWVEDLKDGTASILKPDKSKIIGSFIKGEKNGRFKIEEDGHEIGE